MHQAFSSNPSGSADPLGTTVAPVDPVDAEWLRRLLGRPEPWLSIYLPTDRTGPGTVAGPIRLRNLARHAEQGPVPDLLGEPAREALRELIDDRDFWQHQGDSLAVFAGEDRLLTRRLPIHVAEHLAVGTARVRPLVPLLAGHDTYHVLALSAGQVRLVAATRHAAYELELGSIPARIDDVDPDRDHQQHLQFSSQGGASTPNYHGHAADGSADRVRLERFCRRVADGIDAVLGRATVRPLVVAAVESTYAAFRAVCRRPGVLGPVLGSPEQHSVADLQELAWPLVAEHEAADAAQVAERVGAALAAGRALIDPVDIKHAAEQGRVDTLFVDAGRAWDGYRPVDDPVDAAILATLGTSGAVDQLPAGCAPSGSVALLRY